MGFGIHKPQFALLGRRLIKARSTDLSPQVCRGWGGFDTRSAGDQFEGSFCSEQTRLRLIACETGSPIDSIRVGIGLGTLKSALLLEVYIAIDRFYMDFVPAAANAASTVDILPRGALG